MLKQFLMGCMLALSALVSGGVSAGELITDGATWQVGGGETNYLAAVYGDYTNMGRSIKAENIDIGFEAVYVGKNAPHGPYDWQFAFYSPEISNTEIGTKTKLHVKIGPYNERTLNAVIDRFGSANMTNQNNSKADMDWLIDCLKKPISEVGTLQVTVPVRELGLKTTNGPYGRQVVRNDNMTERRYTFGLINAKKTIEQAKANWPD